MPQVIVFDAEKEKMQEKLLGHAKKALRAFRAQGFSSRASMSHKGFCKGSEAFKEFCVEFQVAVFS